MIEEWDAEAPHRRVPVTDPGVDDKHRSDPTSTTVAYQVTPPTLFASYISCPQLGSL